MAKALTIQLIQQKTKTDSLLSIKNLNLWGNDLDDLKVLRQLPNLEVLSLSVNRISTLKEISSCSKLKELYLRKNEIDDINELRYVQHLPNLKVLWLQGKQIFEFIKDNPCSETQHYRYIVIRYLPNLEKLDNMNVTEQDRAMASRVQLPEDKESGQKNQEEHVLIQSYQKHQEPIQRTSTGYRDQYTTQKEDEHQNLRGSQVQHQQQQAQQQQQQLHQQQQREQQYQQQQQFQQMPPIQYQTHVEVDDYQQQNDDKAAITHNYERNENILCAVLALIKELDENSLEVVKRDVERKLGSKNNRKN